MSLALDGAASYALRATTLALGQPLVGLVARRFPTRGVCTRSGDCGKACPRGGAQFEVGELRDSKLFQAKSLACTLDAVVHETKAHLVARSGRYNLQLAIAC